MNCVRLFAACGGVFAAALLAFPLAAAARPPRVHFDMPLVLACRDATAPPFAAANPNHRLVEVRLEISALLLAGEEKDLTELYIRIDSPQRSVEVVDYLPKTWHESRLAGPVGVTRTDETSGTLGINLAGQSAGLTTIGASAGLGQKHGSAIKYDLLPPLETVAASGTLLRGSGAFFKLKASPRRPLEGATQLILVLRVPRDWRADYLRVQCQATAIERGLVSSLNQTIPAGGRKLLVALYLEGDEEARHTAEEFANREASLSAQPAKESEQPAKENEASRAKSSAWPGWKGARWLLHGS